MSPGDQHGMGRTWRVDEVPNPGDSVPGLGDAASFTVYRRLMRAFLDGASWHSMCESVRRAPPSARSMCACYLSPALKGHFDCASSHSVPSGRQEATPAVGFIGPDV